MPTRVRVGGDPVLKDFVQLADLVKSIDQYALSTLEVANVRSRQNCKFQLRAISQTKCNEIYNRKGKKKSAAMS